MMINGSFCLDAPTVLNCDVLIIGSGAGGSIVATELVAAGKDVLLIEEGSAIWAEDVPTSTAEGVARMWRNGGLTVAMGATPIAYAEGRCVGGSTEINSAIIQRAPDEMLDQWAKDYKIKDFGAEALSPYYKKSFHVVKASKTDAPLGRPSDILHDAAETKGWAISSLERAQDYCVGTNMCASGCPTGGKQSSSQRLKRALSEGLRLVAQCRVHKLMLNGKRVKGAKAIATDAQGNHHVITINCRTVFVAAGAVHTPALLRASGITHAVGNTLRLHPTIKMMAKFPFTINAQDHRLPLYAITEFMPNIRLGGSVFVPGFFGMAIAEDWEHRSHLLPVMDQCGLYYAMVRARGTGKVRPSLNNKRDPLVTYRLAPEDYNHLRQGLTALAELMFAAGATHLYPSLSRHAGWTNLDQVRTDLASDKALRKTNLMTIHLFSSCPMGEDLERCAANSYGRVHKFENLYIADASLIPEAPGVNPQATIMAIVYRNVAAWLAQNGEMAS